MGSEGGWPILPSAGWACPGEAVRYSALPRIVELLAIFREEINRRLLKRPDVTLLQGHANERALDSTFQRGGCGRARAPTVVGWLVSTSSNLVLLMKPIVQAKRRLDLGQSLRRFQLARTWGSSNTDSVIL